MNADICRTDEAREVVTAERCSILEISNDADDAECSIARARVAPGVTTEWHWLEGIDERYVILSGRGRVEVGDLPPAIVGVGDVVRIPAGAPQRITNVADADLMFLAVCTPRFVQSAYRRGRNTPD